MDKKLITLKQMLDMLVVSSSLLRHFRALQNTKLIKIYLGLSLITANYYQRFSNITMIINEHLQL